MGFFLIFIYNLITSFMFTYFMFKIICIQIFRDINFAAHVVTCQPQLEKTLKTIKLHVKHKLDPKHNSVAT